MPPLAPGLDVYSIALLTAMLLLAASLAVTAFGSGRSRAAAGLGLLALAFAAFALTFHWRLGHPYGSAEAMPPFTFLVDHRALVVVLLLAAASGLYRRRAR